MAQSVIINGSTYSNVPYVEIPKSGGDGDAIFYDCSIDDAVAANLLKTKTAHSASGQITGTMEPLGSVTDTISTKAETVTIGEGYTTGGTISIDSTEQAKIIAGNIKNGITILGVQGKNTVVDTEISSDYAGEGTILYGKKAYVNGNLVTGQYTGVSVSQDSTTKVLTIS